MSMATRHRTFTFSSTDTDGISGEMAQFSLGADGRRWLNIVPDADEGEIHTGSVFWKAFSSRGPVIPQLTWLPAHDAKAGREPHQVGVAHATGRDVVDRLAASGVHAPDHWKLFQDHQKRGVLYAVREGSPMDEIVAFAVGTLRELSPFGFEDAYLATFSQQ
jgi:hypothetical protein